MLLTGWKTLNHPLALLFNDINCGLLFAEYDLFKVSPHYLLLDDLNDPVQFEFLFEYLGHCELRSHLRLLLLPAPLHAVIVVRLAAHRGLCIFRFFLFGRGIRFLRELETAALENFLPQLVFLGGEHYILQEVPVEKGVLGILRGGCVSGRGITG